MPVEEWSPTPNFSSRDGRKIIAIVDHITAGTFPGCLSWMQNPVSQGSAHYLVTKLGRIIQLVKEGDKAWGNGVVNKPNWKLYDGTNPNLYTLSIEHEGQPRDIMPETQYQATLFLHKELTAKYGIPIDTDHIIGHYRIDSVNRPNCPGTGFPWDRLFKDLKGVVIMTQTIQPVKGPIAPDDIYLSVRVRESLVAQATTDINKLGFAVKRLELA
jgi:N-acetylmuramoyl-L-alanine amidase